MNIQTAVSFLIKSFNFSLNELAPVFMNKIKVLPKLRLAKVFGKYFSNRFILIQRRSDLSL